MFKRLRLWFGLRKFRGSTTNPFLTPVGEVRTRRNTAADLHLINEWLGDVDRAQIATSLMIPFDQGEEDENGFTINYGNEWDSPRYREEGSDPREILHRRDFGAI